jgi:hypothetical protein
MTSAPLHSGLKEVSGQLAAIVIADQGRSECDHLGIQAPVANLTNMISFHFCPSIAQVKKKYIRKEKTRSPGFSRPHTAEITIHKASFIHKLIQLSRSRPIEIYHV